MSSVLLSGFQYTTGYATQMACEGSLENKRERHKQGNDSADFHPLPATSHSPTGTTDSSSNNGVIGVMKRRFCPPRC